MPYQVLESRHHQKHEMLDGAASLRRASHFCPSAFLQQRYAPETPLYRNAHCGLGEVETW
jgi:hypothetical protein